MRRLLPGLALVGALWAGCEGALFHVTIDDSGTTTVPAASPLEPVLGDLGFGDFVNMDLTSASELENQGVAPGDISSVRFTDFTLTALSPEGADLSFLSSIAVYAEAPGLDQVLIASQDDFPDGAEVVDMVLEDVDLTDYVVSESMTITTDVSGQRPSEETEVEAAFAIRVGVTSQGCAAATRGGD